MIVYLSGTGNSRLCAMRTAKALSDIAVDAAEYIKSSTKADLVSEKPWVFVAPTYGWQLPHIFVKFLSEAKLSGSRSAYFIMTCGGDIGAASEKLADLCAKLNLEYKGVLPLVMPENYIALFSAPDAAQANRIISDALPKLDNAIGLISEGKPFPPMKTNAADKLKSGIVNKVFYKFIIKATPFYSTKDCTSCGKCVKSCMLNNITLENSRPVWGKNCTHCMACISYCPVRAIEYGKSTKNKVRYRCTYKD